jgi:hypothetical protein
VEHFDVDVDVKSARDHVSREKDGSSGKTATVFDGGGIKPAVCTHATLPGHTRAIGRMRQCDPSQNKGSLRVTPDKGVTHTENRTVHLSIGRRAEMTQSTELPFARKMALARCDRSSDGHGLGKEGERAWKAARRLGEGAGGEH